MGATIIDGTAIAAGIRDRVARDAARIADEHGRPPGLAVVLVGNNPASLAYVGMKHKACLAAGIRSLETRLPADSSQETVLEAVRAYNRDDQVDGILVQLPLPAQCDTAAILDAIDPARDVDGFHPVNAGRLLAGLPCLEPCTPAGIIELLRQSSHDPAGKHVVVVGRSTIVGRPVAVMLMRKGPGGDATVTVCHSRTPDLPSITRSADILIAAIGKSCFITADMVRPGAVVIDVGVNRVDDSSAPRGYRLTGDVDFAQVSQKAAAISPVPGGVGPMTIAMLLVNTCRACRGRIRSA